jgi:hypothetical protein
MTRFVIDAPVTIQLAADGAAVVSPDHELFAPPWPRSQALALDWPDLYRAEYIALTRLQADALVTFDTELASAASSLVPVAPLADLLAPP